MTVLATRFIWTAASMTNAGRAIAVWRAWIGRHNFQSCWLHRIITTKYVPLIFIFQFFCIDKWWFFLELLQDSPHDPDGVCLVWNTRFKKSTPEYIFHCQSPVLSCCFARFHPNLILGGTYSGKIVLWDNRSPKRTPVQRSPLSAMAHTVKHLNSFDPYSIQS